MDALENLDPETKMSDLTVAQFEAVMLRTFCRVADFAAVRFAQEQRGPIRPMGEEDARNLNDRADGSKQVREMIAGEGWPKFKVWKFVAKED